MNNKRILLPVLLFGSLWGISETVIGYLLHLLPFSLSGFVMFPAGFCFMACAFKKTGSIKSIFFTGFTAAAIKLVGLALPFLPPYKIFVPAASIILEALAVGSAYSLFAVMRSRVYTGRKAFWVEPLLMSISASLGWRIIFVMMQLILTCFGIPSNLIAGGLEPIVCYIVLEGLANAPLLIAASCFVRKARPDTLRIARITPAAAACALIAAAATTVIFALL